MAISGKKLATGLDAAGAIDEAEKLHLEFTTILD